eukprot:m.54850 g.54850  ORF g.54850 m.54850 type:complete len:237 (-) comp12485_c0_seq2:258-968(-)
MKFQGTSAWVPALGTTGLLALTWVFWVAALATPWSKIKANQCTPTCRVVKIEIELFELCGKADGISSCDSMSSVCGDGILGSEDSFCAGVQAAAAFGVMGMLALCCACVVFFSTFLVDSFLATRMRAAMGMTLLCLVGAVFCGLISFAVYAGEIQNKNRLLDALTASPLSSGSKDVGPGFILFIIGWIMILIASGLVVMIMNSSAGSGSADIADKEVMYAGGSDGSAGDYEPPPEY